MSEYPFATAVSTRRVLVALVAGICLLVAILAVALGFPQLIGGEASYIVLSDSMEPTFGAGDVVVVESVKLAALEEGDIVTYRNPRIEDSEATQYVTHRVVDVNHIEGETTLRTKGDANDDPDPYVVTEEDVVGRYLVHAPSVGHLLLFARTNLGIILLLYVPGIALFTWGVRTLMAEVDFGEE